MGLFGKGSEMRNLLLVLLFSLVTSVPALAQEWSGTAYGRAATGYVYKDLDLVATGDPVVQGGLTLSRGPWSFDGWASYGPQGGLAQEFDASVFYTTTRGCFRTQLAVQYFAVNLDDSLGDMRDDMVALYADFSCTFELGDLTVAPVIRPVQLVGLDDLESQTLIQPGIRIGYQFTESVSGSLDLRDSVNLTSGHAALRYDAGVSWQATDELSFRLGVDGTENSQAVYSFGFARTF